MGMIIRPPGSDETQDLRRIWTSAFGNGDESAFFSYYFKPEYCLTAVCDGLPVSAGYLLPVGRLDHDNGERVSCAMIYGVAVLPRYRGRGFGTMVVRELVSQGKEYGAIALCPSDDSLFRYYRDCADFCDWFYTHERRLSSPPRVAASKISAVTPLEYSRLREKLLADVPHIAMDLHALGYQETLCQTFGGGLFMLDSPGRASCAVVERQKNGAILIKELLSPNGCEDYMIASIAAAFPAKEYWVRTPAHRTDGSRNCRRFGMLAAAPVMDGNADMNGFTPWFGLAFD
ncbi:MAG: GNAT family N-acetyltransferase [Oscillospiraceae bacterium]|nr:GNAT family N-acetyltransferase [Oscillospiraceae bacterium]